MKSAYLYVRVSTDEQKRKGYSLPEQEDRLLKYCKYYDIEVKGIYREDFSAKNFNRPEWNRLFSEIKKKSSGEDKNILFIKWDRFSRNIEYAYEMIGKLRKYKTTAKAIDQPIDFSVPESTVMLAVYLAVPEAENTRRAQNTANGIRRAKLMGRYPSKAPLGFINLRSMDGKKGITPKEPEAEIIKWVFYQVAKNDHKISQIMKIANDKGLLCSRSHFFRILHNPVYCGLIPVKLESGEEQMVKGLHEPLISESLFNQVQSVINTKRKTTAKKDDLQSTFFLRGFLICPVCDRKLGGSYSKGRAKRYPYYHCRGGCRVRIGAIILNDCYQNKLQQLILSNNTIELFKNILVDQNIKTQKASYLYAQKVLERKIKEEVLTLSQGRKLFIAGILKIDDYNELKKDNKVSIKNLKKEARDIVFKLKGIDKKNQIENKALVEIFQRFSEFDVSDKRHLVSLIPPIDIDFKTRTLSLGLNQAFLKILSKKSNRKTNRKNEFH
ncbi:recombinase family protein [Flavobacterium sp. Fl-318]|jgi:site-specific DNA recombinase|uniref:Recombinase family protein n=1 Tax=Flavobacterium cupriresistens TaxID=2893885 RepID=A0ABU4R6T9_9FLAO|nr:MULTISPECIES: recombinase family protein [unclassified Flavobacterium]MDX6187743.1 recombinase family protein [Flavobacterium sp. Fl-318]UFH42334.1 recombinase family protein [Flavobacterium sp. F-323]